MQSAGWPRFTPVADHALLVSFSESISDAANASVAALDQALEVRPFIGLMERVPAMVSLLVDFDPLLTDHVEVQDHVERLLGQPVKGLTAGRLREVEVCYDAELAPDLASVARASGLSVEGVVELHLQAEYRVCMYGFAPGFAYLSGIPAAMQVPRKAAALRDIPTGSVLVAGAQCLVTTLVMPTGWSIIGRSPTRIFTPAEHSPFLFDVGDRVRFTRIDRARYERRRDATGHV